MPFDSFERLLKAHMARYGTPEVVSLQGEGEPTLHPDFFRMAEHVVAIGAQPYAITNGSHKHPDRFVGIFSRIGVSLDSLDERTASAIGRYNLPRVLEFIRMLAPKLKIVIHSVAHGEYTPPIAAWCQQHGYAHVVQPLQTKADYARRYQSHVSVSPSVGRFSCAYLALPRMCYYNLDGLEMPCCYIKDVSRFNGLEQLMEHQYAGTWPACCAGCRFGCSRFDGTAPATSK